MLDLDVEFDPLQEGKPIAFAVFNLKGQRIGGFSKEQLVKALDDFDQLDYEYGQKLPPIQATIVLSSEKAKL